jgi:hypothetical protein
VHGDAAADLAYVAPNPFPQGGGVIGLAYYANMPAFIQINVFAGIYVWDSTVCHETGHIDGQEDLYTHPLTCNPNARYTRMSCGTYIGVPVDPYDIWVVWNTYIPDIPSYGAAQRLGPSTVRLTYNGVRASSATGNPYALTSYFNGGLYSEPDNFGGHYSRNLDNATRVAIFRSVGGSDWALIGYGPVPAGPNLATFDVTDDPGCGGIRYALHPESAIPVTWLGGIPFISSNLLVLEVF